MKNYFVYFSDFFDTRILKKKTFSIYRNNNFKDSVYIFIFIFKKTHYDDFTIYQDKNYKKYVSVVKE